MGILHPGSALWLRSPIGRGDRFRFYIDEGSNPSVAIMPMIMDLEDELKSLAQENKELRARIKELNNVINNKDAQLDAYRLKIDELQQALFSIPSASQ